MSETGNTTLTGRVFAPNGTLPLYDVNVYVPNSDPGAFSDTLACTTCATSLPGDPIVSAVSDEHGNFTLVGVPSGANIPLVVTIGKWRKQVIIPNVPGCSTSAVDKADTTLPKSRTDISGHTKSVDLPNIAISTGGADSLECLIRKLGVDDSEIKTDGQDGRVHLWADKGSPGVGVAKFENGFGGGTGNFADSAKLWGTGNDPGKLANYDIVILSCEGNQYAQTKPQAALDHMKAYADAGGRVFLSHWHNIWVEGDTHGDNGNGQKPAQWTKVAKFSNSDNGLPDGSVDKIDEVDNPKGVSFGIWALDPQVNISATQDAVPIQPGTGKTTCSAVDPTLGEDWVTLADGTTPQMFQFTTPNEQVDQTQRCGKVVFSDMHVSGDGNQGGAYPNTAGGNGKACSTGDLSPQEKALAFMFFDISSCVGSIQ